MEDMKVVCAIPESVVDTINAAIYAQFPSLGTETFSAPYSSDGNLPVTHYVCALRRDLNGKNAFFAWFAANHPEVTLLDYVSVEGVLAKIAGWGLQAVDFT